MPIRQGGILASRASTWPRDHFCRSTIAPRASWPTTWNEFLPISCRSRRSRYWVSETWRAPCLWRPLPASLAGGAGARPDHPINGNGLRRTFANNLALWHPGNPHTIIEALAAGEVNRVVTRYGSPIAAHRETRIERKSRLRSGPRPPLRSEQRQGRGEMEMAEGIIVVVFEAPAQPSDRFSISTQLQFGEADPHHPIA